MTTVQTIGFLRTQIENYHIVRQHDQIQDGESLLFVATPISSLDNGGYSKPVEITVNCPSIFEYRPGEIEVRA